MAKAQSASPGPGPTSLFTARAEEQVRDRASDLRVFLTRRWDRVGWRRELAFSEYSGSAIREDGSGVHGAE